MWRPRLSSVLFGHLHLHLLPVTTMSRCVACRTEDQDVSCDHQLCETCCLLAQSENGVDCSTHDKDEVVDVPPFGSASAVRRSLGIPQDPAEVLKKHIGDKKVLTITSPLLVFCPHSLMLYELRSRQRGIQLVLSKTDLWMSTHGRYPEAAEVRTLTKIIVSLLGSHLIRDDPVEMLSILREPILKYTALVHVRGTAGAAGMRTFLAKTAADVENPDDWKEALSAACAAGARARREAVTRDDVGGRGGASGDASSSFAAAVGSGVSFRGRWRGRRGASGGGGAGGRGHAASAASASGNGATGASSAANL